MKITQDFSNILYTFGGIKYQKREELNILREEARLKFLADRKNLQPPKRFSKQIEEEREQDKNISNVIELEEISNANIILEKEAESRQLNKKNELLFYYRKLLRISLKKVRNKLENTLLKAMEGSSYFPSSYFVDFYLGYHVHFTA